MISASSLTQAHAHKSRGPMLFFHRSVFLSEHRFDWVEHLIFTELDSGINTNHNYTKVLTATHWPDWLKAKP